MVMDKAKIDMIMKKLSGARQMTALELNDMHFSGKKTVLTPERLRNAPPIR